MQQSVLNGKVALITGSARRIGATTAHYLHDAGMNIIVHYAHSYDEAAMLTASFNQKRPASAKMLQADFSQSFNMLHFAEKIVALFGRLDALVNNASQFFKTPINEIDETAFDQLLQVNLKMPFLLSQALAPALNSSQGCIVNITDIHGNCPLRHYGMYSISKAGLIMATKVLAKELAPRVRVNAISPGAIMWPEGDNLLSDEAKNDIIASMLMTREGEPDDIAKGVLFFIRDARYSTGQILAIDGGRLLTTI
ncbi:MAG TPA: pteridine reductase [Myxococcota bacterium]|nr:pteridine reductase [Myxococcota bacterium]